MRFSEFTYSLHLSFINKGSLVVLFFFHHVFPQNGFLCALGSLWVTRLAEMHELTGQILGVLHLSLLSMTGLKGILLEVCDAMPGCQRSERRMVLFHSLAPQCCHSPAVHTASLTAPLTSAPNSTAKHGHWGAAASPYQCFWRLVLENPHFAYFCVKYAFLHVFCSKRISSGRGCNRLFMEHQSCCSALEPDR